MENRFIKPENIGEFEPDESPELLPGDLNLDQQEATPIKISEKPLLHTKKRLPNVGKSVYLIKRLKILLSRFAEFGVRLGLGFYPFRVLYGFPECILQGF